ncbi:MAG: 16S rRNA (uracil(1498)-N(3))-methyltransferase [Acidobacteria bacterium]|nr:16S rRNA (uracil(1498)-N(3))-methyltransferase [Acidobacteriota bacterium]
MRRFYAPTENFNTGKITLELEETRHLRDVLRLREGEKIQVFDGAGKEFLGAIETVSKKETQLKIIKEVSPTAAESNLDLTLAVALLKGEKFDLVLQKAVELGVTRLIPLNTKRADVKLKDGEKKLERWRKIVIEATKQCGRAKLMQIESPVDFEKFIALADGTKFLFAEKDGASFPTLEDDKKIVAIIGAEGGWEDAEIEAAREKGFQIVTFGGRILRAETAAISTMAVLQNRFGDFV